MAGKRKIPDPTIPKGKKVYTFFFYDSHGKRKQFSTGTDSLSEAKTLAEHIHELYGLSYNDERAIELDDRAYEEYYGHSKVFKPQNIDKILLTLDDAEIIDKYITENEPGFALRFIKAISHYASLSNEVESLREQLKDFNDLKDSMLAQQAKSISLCPTYSEALEIFLEEYKPTVSFKHSQEVERVNKDFIEYTENQKPASITIAQIRDFLNKKSKDNPDPDTKRKKVSALLSTFFYKAAERYNFQCQFSNMSIVRSKTQKKRKIVWYDLPEMEEIIQGLTPYWSAMVATMCYAGIGIKELRGIRNEDFIKVVQLNKGGQAENKYYLNIEPHLDRTLKTKNREELVPI
ncbi:MAG: hypothetical protein NE328_19215, partial [Lentisphaeraceae bacterium]|nr:hypothetical protein [Lentisphaeraceae bacterium]